MNNPNLKMARHGRPINTVFDLLGHKENDITAAVGWTLTCCRPFLSQFLQLCGIPLPNMDAIQLIDLQKHGSDDGYTDIEIVSDDFHLILEAKCGWTLPTEDQLAKYRNRFKCGSANAVLVTVSECTQEYVRANNLQPPSRNCRGVYLAYGDLLKAARAIQPRCRDGSRQVLIDLQNYLGGIMASGNRESNMVYTVALADDTPPFSLISWIDIVEKENRYFHPVGGGWPGQPVNYLGFRYHGQLQSIRFVEDYMVAPDGLAVHSEIAQIDPRRWDRSPIVTKRPHFIYRLGPPVRPKSEVRSGNIRANRMWAAIDLLLTSETVLDAVKRTKARQKSDV